MDDTTRIQVILGIIIFGGTLLGLLVLGLLRVLAWQRDRALVEGALPYQEQAATLRTVASSHSAIDPYSIAEEALKLVDQVQAENAKLKRQLAKFEAKNPYGGTMAAERWLKIINDDPNLVPHVGIEGATRTGKTTLATGILHNRPGDILILTAKAGDTWGGLPYVTIDDDGSFRSAAAAFTSLLQEVKRRLVAVKHGQQPGAWLNVVLDDYPALRDACPDADAAFLLIARIGASLRVRLLVLTYSLNVKELGLEGKGDARHHFVWIKRTRRGEQRTATMMWEDSRYDLDVDSVIAQAAKPLDQARTWKPVSPPNEQPQAQHPKRSLSIILQRRRQAARRTSDTKDADLLLQKLLDPKQATPSPVPVSATIPANPVPLPPLVVPVLTEVSSGIARSDADTKHQAANTSIRADTASDTAPIVRDLPDDVIRALLGAGWSANQVARHLYGSKQKRLQRIDQALAGSVAEANKAA